MSADDIIHAVMVEGRKLSIETKHLPTFWSEVNKHGLKCELFVSIKDGTAVLSRSRLEQ